MIFREYKKFIHFWPVLPNMVDTIIKSSKFIPENLDSKFIFYVIHKISFNIRYKNIYSCTEGGVKVLLDTFQSFNSLTIVTNINLKFNYIITVFQLFLIFALFWIILIHTWNVAKLTVIIISLKLLNCVMYVDLQKY